MRQRHYEPENSLEYFALANNDKLHLGDTLLWDGCEYEVTRIQDDLVTIDHCDPLDDLCSPKCQIVRQLTADEIDEHITI